MNIKGYFYILFFYLFILSCTEVQYARVSGYITNGDSIVSIFVQDSIFNFEIDDTGYFYGEIPLEEEVYASVLPYAINMFLGPDQDLEINMDTRNISGSLNFGGRLGPLNNYLKEQEVAAFFNNDDYELSEDEFVRKMERIIDDKITLLKAKNLDKNFTKLEIHRIKYSIAEKAVLYPFFNGLDNLYPTLKSFIAQFPMDKYELFGAIEYRRFLLNYVYLYSDNDTIYKNKSKTENVGDFIVSYVNNPYVRDFLLSATIWRHIAENNSISGAEHVVDLFFKYSMNANSRSIVSEWVDKWSRLSKGKEAPMFNLKGVNGDNISLNDFKGSYVYIAVWATWCVPCKSELKYMERLIKKYSSERLKFLTISIDSYGNYDLWKNYVRKNCVDTAKHGIILDNSSFSDDYQIFSIPRFILISPEGKIVASNAPRPSSLAITNLFEGL